MNLVPKKSLGQNFLIDKTIIKKICETGNISEKDFVLEIGPGTGNLSETILLKKPEKFYVIEKDKRLIEHLNQKFQEKVTVINEDILKYKFNKFKNKNLIVFGNLPYNISSQILIKFIKFNKKDFLFKKLIFMFQKEVADRILAEDNTNLYGRLSIISSWRFKIKKIMDIEPSCFYPQPKVISTLLTFEPKSNCIEFKNSSNLEHITNIFFNQRRKMIKKPLNILFKDPKKVSEELKLDLKLRPQNLEKNTFYKICLAYERLIK